jgi:hypothetical protein
MHGVTLLLPPPDVQASIVAKLVSGDPDAMTATKLTIRKLVVSQCISDGTKVKQLGTLGGIELAMSDKKKSSITLANGCVLTPHPSWQFIADDGGPANLAVWNCSSAPPTDGEPFTVVNKKRGGATNTRPAQHNNTAREQLVDQLCKEYIAFRTTGRESDANPITCMAAALLNYLLHCEGGKDAPYVYLDALKLTTMDPLSTILLIVRPGTNSAPLMSDERVVEFAQIKSMCANKDQAELNFVKHVDTRAAQITDDVMNSARALHTKLVDPSGVGAELKDGFGDDKAPITDKAISLFFENMAKLYDGKLRSEVTTPELKARATEMHIVSEFQFVCGIMMCSLRIPGSDETMLTELVKNNWRYLSSAQPRALAGGDTLISGSTIGMLRDQFAHSSALLPQVSSNKLKSSASMCDTLKEHQLGSYFDIGANFLKALNEEHMSRIESEPNAGAEVVDRIRSGSYSPYFRKIN